MDRGEGEAELNGGARVREAEILHVGLPLKRPFRHALATRTQSDSIFLKITLDDGTVGWGESLPREYVTGETPASVMDGLEGPLREVLASAGIGGYDKLPAFIGALNIKGGAAACAMELALLDAYGRHFDRPVSDIVGAAANTQFSYSGVVQAASLRNVALTSAAFAIFGLRFVKAKVGFADDTARLKVMRSILGRRANIRLDANCAWSAEEAIKRIGAMRRFDISAVEQPVAADDIEGLKRVAEMVPEDVIADESLCTLEDGRTLAERKACNVFNIRISKCGGLINSLRLAEIARRSGIGIQLGCQVGESGLLSAAGWHFASATPGILFCEGSYGRHLLKEDVTEEDMTISRGGRLMPVKGAGLGVNCLQDVLDRYAFSRRAVK